MWEPIGYSAEDAQVFETDRLDRINKGTLKTKEDLKPKPPTLKLQDTMTFKELSDWYLAQDYVRDKKSYFQKGNSLKNFNQVFGDRAISSITVADIQNYQINREKKDGKARSTIDQEAGEAKSAIYDAYENDKVEESVVIGCKKIESD